MEQYKYLIKRKIMEEKGYLLLVLHTHLPFVRHPDIEYPQEENWLFEAITDCYIPLIKIFNGLINDGVDFKITFSLTPCLAEMLNDSLLQERYLRYLDDRIRLSKKEIERLSKNNGLLLSLAHRHYNRFLKCKEIFQENFSRNLIHAFNFLKDSGKVDILPSGATHAYSPFWEVYPQVVDLQIRLGMQQYKNDFDHQPIGFWLPECGYYPNVDQLLKKNGIKYFFLEKHGVLNGDPRPKFGEFAPVHCPSGIAAFGRNLETREMPWTEYPRDPFYLNYHRDIGFELDQDYLFPYTHQNNRIKTGIKYFCNDPVYAKEIYDPDIAFRRCDEHANHFIDCCQQQIERLSGSMDRKPVIVAMYDTELFGHWWHEGPTWLDMVIRKLVYDQDTIKLITAVEYLKDYPTNQVVKPSMSSWGYQGYNETWLMGSNHWIYPQLYEAIEVLDHLMLTNPVPCSEHRGALDQYIRELLLAQTSDWPFIIWTQTTKEYAENRVKTHIENMRRIYHQVEQNSIDVDWLNFIQNKNNIFSNMDLYEIYKNILNEHRLE